MNVDNGVKLFKYNGLQLANLPWENDKYAPDQLLAAEFVPTPHTLYPDRPQTPPPRRPKGGAEDDHNTEQNGKEEENKTSDAQPVAFVRPPGRYVPPAARRAGSTSLAERMRREREGNTMGPTKVNNHKPGMSISNKKKLPVGMSVANTVSDAKPQKSKNALRRERQRLAKQKGEADAAAEKAKQAAQEPIDTEKLAKKLNKTLKQIEILKEKDPSTLNNDQKKKIASEASVREELASFNLN